MMDRREYIQACIAASLTAMLDCAPPLALAADDEEESSTSVMSCTSMFEAAWKDAERKYGPWGQKQAVTQ